MKRLILSCISCLLPLLITTAATAQPVYRSIDASGNVTFSDQPTGDAVLSEAIPVPPRLSDDQIERAHREVEAVVKRADALHRERLLQRQARRESSRQSAPPVWRTTASESGDRTATYRWRPRLPHFRPLPHDHLPVEHAGRGDHPVFRPRRPAPQPELPEVSQQLLPRGR